MRLRLRQPAEAVQDDDAFLFQGGRDRRKIRKMRSHCIQPDRTASQETAGAGGIRVFKNALEFVVGGTARKQNPGNIMFVAYLADGVEFRLRSFCRSTAITGRQTI